SFRFEAFNDPGGNDIASEFLFFSDLVTVVDGLFVVDVQMGGSLENARAFWESVGDQVVYLEIGVGEFEGGPYETLGTLVPMGWGARAQYSLFAEELVFPYADVYVDPSADPSTMLSLTNVFGGTVAELRADGVADEPIVYIRGENVFTPNFGFQSGALFVDSMEDEVGIRGEGSRFSIIGNFPQPSTLPGLSAAVVGSVGFASSPNVIAVWATNGAAGTSARLGTENYAGDFDGDVLARDDLRVQGEATRDYASNSPSPIGPLAYGSVSASGNVLTGTANLSASWDSANDRYLISVAGESMAFSTHIVSLTVVDGNEPRLATFNTTSGDIAVKIWDLNSGNAEIQDNFSIVIYDANPVVLQRVSVPDGVDADKYSEAIGGSLIQTTPRYTPIEELDDVPAFMTDSE
ncbi:MAG: hypothetical protein JJ974_12625, partial [Phycisphaerales bacterium]|nr:hypothetical protein [Phycisphaerales bacterium]